jgi:2-oxoacid:acceptor oxidoreductase delta subunit (pyruvate/2-ketoisovalerate family)
MNEKITFKRLEEIPPISISLGTMLWNKTGTWRYLKPRYVAKTPPCNEACPAGNDIEGFMVLARQGNFREAWELIKEENPFPGVCGRVCFRPCESSCNRGEYDEPLSIQGVERFLADSGFSMKRRKGSPNPERREQIAVIGSGPAGLTCAYHLARRGYGVTVFEAQSVPGGMLRLGIPEYRLPRAVLEGEISDIQSWGVEIRTNTCVGKDISFEDLRIFEAVFIATGAHRSRNLKIEGEHLKGVFSGLDVLKRIRKEENILLGDKVSVIGGGNVAIDVARSAWRLGVKSVEIYYRRSREEMPAFQDEVEEAIREGIQIHFLSSPVRMIENGGKVFGMECIKMSLTEPDETGRRRPVSIKGSNFSVYADSIITAIGEDSDLSFIPKGVLTIKNGLVQAEERGLAHEKCYFAGGDVTNPYHSVAGAIGSGKRAAIAIHEYLSGAGSEEKRGEANPPVVLFKEINTDYFDHQPRVINPSRSIAERKGTFAEVHQGLTREMTEQEAGRCFNCGVCNGCDNCWVYCPDMAVKRNEGHYEIDYDYCKGCGICFMECPRGTILLEEERR